MDDEMSSSNEGTATEERQLAEEQRRREKMIQHLDDMAKPFFLLRICQFMCRSLCPFRCTIAPSLRSPVQKDAVERSYMNLLMENIISNFPAALSSVFVGYIAYLLFLFTSERLALSVIVTCFLLVLILFGMADSQSSRILFYLSLPYFVAERLRWILLLYATFLVIFGSGLNFLQNASVFRNAIACIFAQVYANFELILRITTSPFKLVSKRIHSIINRYNNYMEKIRRLLRGLRFSLFKTRLILDSRATWSNVIVETCSSKNAIENLCLSVVTDFHHICVDGLISSALAPFCWPVHLMGRIFCPSLHSLASMCKEFKQKSIEKLPTDVLPTEAYIGDTINQIYEITGRKNLTIEAGDIPLDMDVNMNISGKTDFMEMLEQQIDIYAGIIELGKIIFAWMTIIWTVASLIRTVWKAYLFR
ncbi:unnamed protein product, partial [Protopolystoma xenopodis]